MRNGPETSTGAAVPNADASSDGPSAEQCRPSAESWWDEIAALLEALLRMPVADRAAAIDSAVGADDGMRHEIASLLRSAERMADFLEGDAVVTQTLGTVTGEHRGDDETAECDSLLGQSVGGVRVLRRIGRGAFGTVYEAEQRNPRRRVALKVLRPSRMERRFIRRLQFEAQVLARLDHPGIARVLDVGGFDRGEGVQPWIVLELVDGGPIVETLGQAPIRDRVAVLADVCDAIHHAHQRGVIHRDITSSNVLVERTDGRWRSRIVDFGTSRLVNPDEVDGVTATGSGQVMGTLRWMSPEQLSEAPAVLTTAVDIHALGVLGFVILSGEFPWESTDEETDFGVMRAIRERPRRRLRQVDRTVDGDLDGVLQIAMAIEPTHRYASAAAMARDLRNWLDGRPLEGRPPSLSQLVRGLVRRHRAVTASLGVALLAIVAGVSATVVAAERSRREAQRATQRFDDVRALARSLLFELEPMVAALPASGEVRSTLCERAIDYLGRLEGEASDDVVLLSEMADGYERLADVLGHFEIPNLGDVTRCGECLRRAIDLRRRIEALAPGDRPNRIAVARLWFKMGRHAPIEPSAERPELADRPGDPTNPWASGAIELTRALLAEAHGAEETEELERLLAACLSAAALVEGDAHRPALAATLAAEAESIVSRLLARLDGRPAGDPASDPRYRRSLLSLAWTLNDLAQHHGWHRRDGEGALESLDRADSVIALADAPDDDVTFVNIRAVNASTRSFSLRLIGDLPAAIAAADAALALAIRLAEHDPTNARARRLREVSLSRLADAHMDLGLDTSVGGPARREALRLSLDFAERAAGVLAERQALGQLGWWESHYPQVAQDRLQRAAAGLAALDADGDSDGDGER